MTELERRAREYAEAYKRDYSTDDNMTEIIYRTHLQHLKNAGATVNTRAMDLRLKIAALESDIAATQRKRTETDARIATHEARLVELTGFKVSLGTKQYHMQTDLFRLNDQLDCLSGPMPTEEEDQLNAEFCEAMGPDDFDPDVE